MTRDQVFEVVKKNICEILPELASDDIRMEQSLKDDLGANSIDRMDIIVQSMNDLKVKIPMIEFGRLKNIEGIVEVLFANLSNTGA